ncbi:MAG: UDP-3-O-(3-hydroxymyristoyl)glucosamine N-acyltransferase [Saprospiraceae bacterium]|nr:UDP-3-O-(3-hydroxymyristoyl)glucosamine N-acyltransferase [Saprospiraceae bacterium]
MQINVRQIAELVNGEIQGDPEILLYGPGKIDEGKPGTITFLANDKYEHFIYDSNASAVLVNKSFRPVKPVKPTLIFVENVYTALSVLLTKFDIGLAKDSGTASTAVIDNTSIIGQNVSIGHHCIIRKNVEIGDNAIIYGQVFVGDGVRIGKNTKIYPGVKIYHHCVIGDNCVIHANAVIGSDGFGFANNAAGEYQKIPQVGNVILENNVEIGANTVIDRATMGSTLISQGVKLDNLIQIAHNVVIGKNTVIAAQTGIAGSTTIGANCMIGGQVGIVGHIHIADGAMIQAQSGISSSVNNENAKLYGSPAIEYSNYLKSYAYFKKLPDLAYQIRMLENEIDKLRQTLKGEV